jgi:hypothetical protein
MIVKITMPAVFPQTARTSIPRCTPVLARIKKTSEYYDCSPDNIFTAILLGDTVAFFGYGKGDLTYSSQEFFNDYYDVLREYAEGESLTITMQE